MNTVLILDLVKTIALCVIAIVLVVRR